MKAVAGVLGFTRAMLNPACAAAFLISGSEVFLGEGLAGAEQFHHCVGQLCAGGPGFVDAGAGKHVGRARALTDAGVAVSGQEGFSALAGLVERFRSPGAEGPVFEVAPECGMLDVVLQVAIRSARGVAQPGGHEDAHRDQVSRVDVEESEDLRLRKTKCVPHSAGLERRVVRQLDDHLHAQCPFGMGVALRHAQLLVDLLADSADGTIADDGEFGEDIHSGHEGVGR